MIPPRPPTISPLRETISVAFYFNNESQHEKGLIGLWKNGMSFWHTEIGFPMSMYRPSEAVKKKTCILRRDDRLFAYGVFEDHTDIIEGASMIHRDSDSMVFSIDEVRSGVKQQPQRLTIVGKWKDITEKEYPSKSRDIATQFPSGYRPVEVFTFKKGVDVLWARHDRHANRFSRRKQSQAKVTLNYEKGLMKLELSGIVFGKPRDFSNPAYTWIHLNIPYENAIQAAQFAENQVGKPHDPSGIKWAMFWPRKVDHKSYYCVNFVASTLQQAGFLEGINPNGLLPDDLHSFLVSHPDRITAANPYVTAKAWSAIPEPRTFSASSARRSLSSPLAVKGSPDGGPLHRGTVSTLVKQPDTSRRKQRRGQSRLPHGMFDRSRDLYQ